MARDVLTDIKALEAKLGLPIGFYLGLIDEDDWSFVIKLNALVEAACTHSLAALLNTPQLIDSLASLDLGHSKYGKVSLLRTLGSLTSEQAGVLKFLYELRNHLAHNITQVTFSFSTYVAGLDKQQRSNFLARAGHGVREDVTLKGQNFPRNEFVLKAPKFALWMTVAEIIACLYLDLELAQSRLQKLAFEHLRAQEGGHG